MRQPCTGFGGAGDHLPETFSSIQQLRDGGIDSNSNAEVVPELGLMTVAVVDGRWNRVAGATVSNNLGGRTFYFIDGLPNVTAPATDSQGVGGFANVPIRLVEVSAQVAADGRLIGTRSVVPRPGWLTGVQVHPAALPLD